MYIYVFIYCTYIYNANIYTEVHFLYTYIGVEKVGRKQPGVRLDRLMSAGGASENWGHGHSWRLSEALSSQESEEE